MGSLLLDGWLAASPKSSHLLTPFPCLEARGLPLPLRAEPQALAQQARPLAIRPLPLRLPSPPTKPALSASTWLPSPSSLLCIPSSGRPFLPPSLESLRIFRASVRSLLWDAFLPHPPLRERCLLSVLFWFLHYYLCHSCCFHSPIVPRAITEPGTVMCSVKCLLYE